MFGVTIYYNHHDFRLPLPNKMVADAHVSLAVVFDVPEGKEFKYVDTALVH